MSFGITYSAGGEIIVKGSDYASSPQFNPIKVDVFGYQFVALQRDAIGLAKDTTLTSNFGVDATGVVAPAGATGIRGWLSGIYNQMTTNNTTMTSGNQKVQVTNGLQAATAGIDSTSQLSVTTAAVAVFGGAVNGKTVFITNMDSSNYVFVGKTNGVTATSGFPIPPKGTWSFDVVSGTTPAIFAVVASGSATLATMVLN